MDEMCKTWVLIVKIINIPYQTPLTHLPPLSLAMGWGWGCPEVMSIWRDSSWGYLKHHGSVNLTVLVKKKDNCLIS